MSTTLTRWLDLGERTLATYAQAFAGLLLADSTGMLSLGAVRAAAIAALPALLAAIKSAFALGLGGSGTASLLPAPRPVPADAPPVGMAEPVTPDADAPSESPAGA